MKKLVDENEFLAKVGLGANLDVSFKNKSKDLLHGIAFIGELLVDISIYGNKLVLNSVGDLGGSATHYSELPSRGKGWFRKMFPSFVKVMYQANLEPRIYLAPASPAWKNNYNLVENELIKGRYRYWLDLTKEYGELRRELNGDSRGT